MIARNMLGTTRTTLGFVRDPLVTEKRRLGKARTALSAQRCAMGGGKFAVEVLRPGDFPASPRLGGKIISVVELSE